MDNGDRTKNERREKKSNDGDDGDDDDDDYDEEFRRGEERWTRAAALGTGETALEHYRVFGVERAKEQRRLGERGTGGNPCPRPIKSCCLHPRAPLQVPCRAIGWHGDIFIGEVGGARNKNKHYARTDGRTPILEGRLGRRPAGPTYTQSGIGQASKQQASRTGRRTKTPRPESRVDVHRAATTGRRGGVPSGVHRRKKKEKKANERSPGRQNGGDDIHRTTCSSDNETRGRTNNRNISKQKE